MPPSDIPLTFVTFRKSISHLKLIGLKLLSRHEEKIFQCSNSEKNYHCNNVKKLLDFLVQEKLYKRCFCDIEDASRTFFGTNNIASLAYLFSLGAHFARRHDFPPSSHVSRSSDPVPHPRLGLRVNNLQKYIKLSMYGIFDESCEYKRRIIYIYITRIQGIC